MKRTTITAFATAALLIASASIAAEQIDLITGGPAAEPRPVTGIEPADFALRLYRIERRLDALEATQQSDQQSCNCTGGDRCTCGADCQCKTPATPARHKIFVDPATGLKIDGPTIIQLSTPGCGPCVRWWGTDDRPGERSIYLSRNWKTKQVYGGANLYPSYRIWDGQRWLEHTGPMSSQQFAGLIKK